MIISLFNKEGEDISNYQRWLCLIILEWFGRNKNDEEDTSNLYWCILEHSSRYIIISWVNTDGEDNDDFSRKLCWHVF